MATNQDSFVITAAMLTPAWVKPTVSFTTAAGEANATDAYLPRTLVQKAGSPGSTSSAVQSPLDPNYAFAIAAEGPAVDSIPTLSVTNVES
jgi:hypothetical protein